MGGDTKKEHDFLTWKDVQESEIEYWQEEVSYLKKCANIEEKIDNWEYVKDAIRFNTDGLDVEEEFYYDEDKWIEEIAEQVKPYFVKLLKNLETDEELDYSDYILNFWN